MKTPFHLSVAASAVALCSTGAFAQSVDLPEDEEVNSETIVVTANRTERAISQVGESVTLVEEEEIVNRQPSEVLDILRTVPGVTLRRQATSRTGGSLCPGRMVPEPIASWIDRLSAWCLTGPPLSRLGHHIVSMTKLP